LNLAISQDSNTKLHALSIPQPLCAVARESGRCPTVTSPEGSLFLWSLFAVLLDDMKQPALPGVHEWKTTKLLHHRSGLPGFHVVEKFPV
jgi:hypothetical protein